MPVTPPLPLIAIRQPAFLYGPDARIAEANDLAESLAGRPLAGCSAADVIAIFGNRHPDGTLFVPAELPPSRALAGEEAIDVPLVVTAADGRTVHLLVSASPIRDGERTIGALVVWQDVSALEAARAEQSRLRSDAEAKTNELRAREETLRESEEQFRSVLDNSRDAIYRLNVQTGRYEYVSPASRSIVGYSPDELMALDRETSLSMIHPDDVDALRAAVAGLEDSGEGEAVYRQRTKSGEYRWISNRMSLVRDSAGRPLYRVGNIRDITESRKADEALRESEEELRRAAIAATRERDQVRNLLDIAGVMILALDTEGRVTMINRRGCEILDRPEEEILGKDWAETFVPEETRAGLKNAFRRVMAGELGGFGRNENPVLTRDGEERHILWSNRLISDADGRITGILSSGEDITERKHAEDALRISEARFRMLHESMRDAFVQVSMDGRILEFNDAYCEMLGYTADELSALTYQELTPERWHAFEEGIVRDQIVPRGYSDVYEKEYRRKDGTTFPVELRTILSRDEDGRPCAMWGIARDITERKQAEDALRDSEERFRALYEHSQDAIVLSDPRDGGRILSANPAACRMLGWTEEELVGRGRDVLFDLADPQTIALLQERNRTGAAFAELIYRRRDKSTFPGEVNTALFTDSHGDVRSVAIIRDITRRKRAEEELAASEAKYRQLFESMAEGFVIGELIRDPAGRVVDYRFLEANPAYERQTGFPRERSLSMTILELIPDLEDAWVQQHARVVETGEPLHWEQYNAVAGRWYEILSVPAGPERFASIFLDVSQRKEAESRLEKYADDLQRSNEELQRFAYVASHDLQEPLRSIISFSQLLERRYKGQLDADADDYIAFIVDGGNRMQRLIRDLLQLSRIETQAKPLRPTDAAVVVASVLRAMESRLAEAGATVEVDDLPVVMADEAQLVQVFANLVGNAVKYRRRGVRPRVRIAAERRGDWWEFAVQDNGIGIEAEYFDRIFEMFQRLHTHDKYEGTGIGLAVVKRIVDRHGGEIRVESTPGKGSTFFFTLAAA